MQCCVAFQTLLRPWSILVGFVVVALVVHEVVVGGVIISIIVIDAAFFSITRTKSVVDKFSLQWMTRTIMSCISSPTPSLEDL
jgi:hypothetical protein